MNIFKFLKYCTTEDFFFFKQLRMDYYASNLVSCIAETIKQYSGVCLKELN